jgi:hypothetical protein
MVSALPFLAIKRGQAIGDRGQRLLPFLARRSAAGSCGCIAASSSAATASPLSLAAAARVISVAPSLAAMSNWKL